MSIRGREQRKWLEEGRSKRSWRLWEAKGEAPSCDPLDECWEVLELGAVGQAVGHQDVLVEVVGTTGAVAAHLVNHLANRQDGGGRGRGGGRAWL